MAEQDLALIESYLLPLFSVKRLFRGTKVPVDAKAGLHVDTARAGKTHTYSNIPECLSTRFPFRPQGAKAHASIATHDR